LTYCARPPDDRRIPRIASNGIEIEYATCGERSGRPLLLIRGLSTQLIHWDPEFCGELARRGHFVVIFDNRDVGLSTKLSSAGVPSIPELTDALRRGLRPEAPYGLSDMADDCVGLLEGLGLPDAHVAGISMGGAIAQTLALRHPDRVRSLASIMASTGAADLPPATPEALEALLSPPPAGREGYIEHSVRTQRVFAGPGFDADAHRALAARAYDRCYCPDGVARQLAAVALGGDRTAELKSVAAPALVIHGADDPLIPLEHGRATARAIPGARLLVVAGMGHDLPRPAWPRLIDALTEHTRRAEQQARRALHPVD
jgi:pimeloyl-ACP methyl ester carboxylesterase